jgi:hypothetical protein
MSFVDKVVNIFASPGELYENVRLTPKTITNWLVPWLIFTVIAVALTQLVMSDPAIVDQMRSMMRQRIAQAVAEGKITQEMADQQIEAFGPGSTLFTITTIGGTVLWTFAAMFVLGLVYWVIGKSVMKAPAPYGKVVEVVGLTYFISTLDQIVTTIIIFVRGSLFSSLSLGHFVSEFDINNKMHILLSKLNVFSIWIVIVTAIGLAKLFQRDFPKVLVIVLVLWVFWVAFSVLTGFGAS